MTKGGDTGAKKSGAISLNFRMRLSPVSTNTFMGVALSLVLSTQLGKSVYFPFGETGGGPY